VRFGLSARPGLRAVSAACALVVAGAMGSSPATSASAATSADFARGVSSSAPLPATVDASSLPDADGSLSPMADTPDGFILQHPGIRRSDYVYDSDTVYQGSYHCSGSSCTLLAQVTAQLHEVAIGGSSHTWQLTMNMRQYSNPGHITWSYFATYWCGVNVSGGNDYLCNNGAAPSDVSMSVNTLVNKPWGSTNSITVFPMVQASTQFSNGPKVTTKFRGWDTLSRSSTTRLNTSSGTGG
jgi:hypothetical protein